MIQKQPMIFHQDEVKRCEQLLPNIIERAQGLNPEDIPRIQAVSIVQIEENLNAWIKDGSMSTEMAISLAVKMGLLLAKHID